MRLGSFLRRQYLGLALLLASIAMGSAAIAQSQKPAILVADRVFLNGNESLVAEGAVEALQGETRLKAQRITYDRARDQMRIEGPITLSEGSDTVILAEFAELDAELQNGLLRGARMVMEQQLQLAAHQINRVNGRYSQLYKAAVTSCRVCGSNEPPLWQIRARRMVHDQEEKQLYFEDMQFLIRDTPVFYLPRLRLPDPTLKRASGFLIPSIRRNSQLGTGLKTPYFIRIGDHRDLTLTPYLSAETRTLELRYRQAFAHGEIEFNGAVTRDSLTTGTRAYGFLSGAFDLRRDFKLTFDVEAVNDKTYLVDYAYSDKDRLDSEVAITRTRRDEYMRAALLHYYSLRVGESNSTLPTLIGDLQYERRLFPRALGGELRLAAAAHSHYRYSDLNTDGPDADLWADGLDMSRLSAEARWLRNWTLSGGLRLGANVGLSIDRFDVTQGGGTSLPLATRATPSAAVSLRWPWQKRSAKGATHIIEPMVQLVWVGGNNPNIPNEESNRVEFDEGNLFSISRFSAPDRRERGWSAALGAKWNRIDPAGWQAGLTLGQVIRRNPIGEFSQSSGLSGTYSDLLIAGHFRSHDGLSITARGVFDPKFDISKAEARAAWQTRKYGLGASYVWLGADTAEARPTTISEWSLDGYYRLSRHWTGSASWRYDVASDRTAEAGIGVLYRNECVDVNLSVSRRFTSSIILAPSTDFSFTVGLSGFKARTDDQSYTRTCQN